MSSIDDFITINKNDSVSYSLLWESLKTYLRGQIISYSTYQNKCRKSRLHELLTQIKDTDTQNAINPSQSLLKQWHNLQVKLDHLTTADAEQLLIHSRATYYEHGDKPSRLLAHQLKCQTASRIIPEIKDSSGKIISDPLLINDVESFYSSLYKSESSLDTAEMTSFFQNVDIPTVDSSVANRLDAPLTLEEIKVSIRAMQNNKTPGLDGFPVEFFFLNYR